MAAALERYSPAHLIGFARRLDPGLTGEDFADAGESAFAGFDDGAGVVGDPQAQHGVSVLGVAQVTGAVEWVEARRGEARGVADVVQPCGGFQEVGVCAENGCQAACPGGDALDVRPAAE